MKKITKHEQNFALCELQHALVDGLFEPTRKAKDSHLRLREIVRTLSLTTTDPATGKTQPDQATLTFVVPTVLNPQAETILLAIIKLSSIHGTKIEATNCPAPWFHSAEGYARDQPRIETHCTLYQLLKEAGMATGKHDYEQLKYYLKQMARVTIEWQNHTSGWQGACHLLEYALREDGQLVVQLNYRLAGAIWGENYIAKIDLNERLALRKDASQTLHRWLSAHLWEGKSEYLLYETLCKHIWTEEAKGSTSRMRLNRLKHEILSELAALPGWTIKILQDGAHITRHKQKKADPPADNAEIQLSGNQ